MVPLIEGSSVATVLTFGDNFVLNIALLLVLVLLLLCSSFFSASETAYSTVNIIRLKNYQDEKKKGAKKAVYIAEKFDLTLITILIGNNFVNIAATTIAAVIFTAAIANPTIANIANTLVMTLLVLVFGEIVPKSFAKENAEKLALKLSGPMYFIIKLLYPISFLFLKLRKALVKNNNEAENTPFMTEDELDNVIEVMEDQGVLDEKDAELISNSINLNDKTVYEIMTPRVDMISVNVNASVSEIKEIFFKYQFSRLPVYKEDKDHMIGLIRERDFFTALIQNGEDKVNILDLMTKPYYVSKSTKVPDLISDMQQTKEHFAIVVDEYGGTDGIVTLEDALEELVGEIYDEYDEVDSKPELIQINENTYEISADMELEDLFDNLNLGKVPATEYSNVGGFIYEQCEELPVEGKEVQFESKYEKDNIENPISITNLLTFKIKKVVDRRIRSVELTISQIDNLENEED